VNEREILEHRLTTLSGLLGSAPLSGPADHPLNERLTGRWRAEQRLLERLLSDAPGAQVRATVDLWSARTEKFLASSADGPASWTDAQGNRWDARVVHELLGETRERLDRWSAGLEP
jgi:hypothetical protein